MKKAKKELNIPERFEVEAMVAVGSKEDENQLSDDIQVKPNERKHMSKIVSKGSFDF